MPKRLEHARSSALGLAGDAEHALAHLDPDVGHHPKHVGIGKSRRDRSSEVAPSSETTTFAPAKLRRGLIELRRLHRQHDQIGPLGKLPVRGDRLAAKLLGQLRRAPEPESVKSIASNGAAAAHAP